MFKEMRNDLVSDVHGQAPRNDVMDGSWRIRRMNCARGGAAGEYPCREISKVFCNLMSQT